MTTISMESKNLVRRYHGTLEKFIEGQVLPTRESNYSDCKYPDVEKLLLQERPEDSHSRLSSYFVTETPEQALTVNIGMHKDRINSGKLKDSDIHVYEVEIQAETKAPMIVIQMIHTYLRNNKMAEAKKAAKLYWNYGDYNWYFLESLTPSLKIIKEVFLDDVRKTCDLVNKKYRADIEIVRAAI